MKSYTDLEQSKKLAEILPIESADMYYFLDPTPAGNIYHIVTPQIDFGVKTKEPEYNKGDIPAWSLAALLAVLDEPYLFKKFNTWSCYVFNPNNHRFISTDSAEPVDVCVEMILKLHEQNLL